MRVTLIMIGIAALLPTAAMADPLIQFGNGGVTLGGTDRVERCEHMRDHARQLSYRAREAEHDGDWHAEHRLADRRDDAWSHFRQAGCEQVLRR